jgi:hypothetical protein
LVAALAWPLPTRCGSVLTLDDAPGDGAARAARRAIHVIALIGFPVVFFAFAALLIIDRARYARLIAEDGVVEWATVAGLAVAAVLAAGNAASERRLGRASLARSAYVVLAVVCALVALEEISWGQRLLGIENPAFFVAYSDQKETNVHNVVQKVTRVTMKWPVGLGYVAYGALLPVWAAASRAGPAGAHLSMLRRLTRWGVLIPPLSLVRGFLLASLLMLDLPTSDEEEIGELFGVLALVLVLLAERTRYPRST